MQLPAASKVASSHLPSHCHKQWTAAPHRSLPGEQAFLLESLPFAETRDRAGDLQIFSLTLSQLSYRGSWPIFESSCHPRISDCAPLPADEPLLVSLQRSPAELSRQMANL